MANETGIVIKDGELLNQDGALSIDEIDGACICCQDSYWCEQFPGNYQVVDVNGTILRNITVSTNALLSDIGVGEPLDSSGDPTARDIYVCALAGVSPVFVKKFNSSDVLQWTWSFTQSGSNGIDAVALNRVISGLQLSITRVYAVARKPSSTWTGAGGSKNVFSINAATGAVVASDLTDTGVFTDEWRDCATDDAGNLYVWGIRTDTSKSPLEVQLILRKYGIDLASPSNIFTTAFVPLTGGSAGVADAQGIDVQFGGSPEIGLGGAFGTTTTPTISAFLLDSSGTQQWTSVFSTAGGAIGGRKCSFDTDKNLWVGHSRADIGSGASTYAALLRNADGVIIDEVTPPTAGAHTGLAVDTRNNTEVLVASFTNATTGLMVKHNIDQDVAAYSILRSLHRGVQVRYNR